MLIRTIFAASFAAAVLLAVPGCAVTRGQQTVGAYVDDAAITTAIKSQLVESKVVDAAAISVETLNGTVMLSGFAKSTAERDAADKIARNASGVKMLKNEIAVRP